MVEIREHKSSSYAPRTYHNAHVAYLTIALAVDFSTAGEKLTAKAAGSKLMQFALRESDLIASSRFIFSRMRKDNAQILNVAGNGIYTLSKHGWTQERTNKFVYDLLAPVYDHWDIKQIVCGGQTGVDIAGAVAGAALGIPVIVTMPKGYKQRFEDGVDVSQTRYDVYKQIMEGVNNLCKTK